MARLNPDTSWDDVHALLMAVDTREVPCCGGSERWAVQWVGQGKTFADVVDNEFVRPLVEDPDHTDDAGVMPESGAHPAWIEFILTDLYPDIIPLEMVDRFIAAIPAGWEEAAFVVLNRHPWPVAQRNALEAKCRGSGTDYLPTKPARAYELWTTGRNLTAQEERELLRRARSADTVPDAADRDIRAGRLRPRSGRRAVD